jgi:hypothetical protein
VLFDIGGNLDGIMRFVYAWGVVSQQTAINIWGGGRGSDAILHLLYGRAIGCYDGKIKMYLLIKLVWFFPTGLA